MANKTPKKSALDMFSSIKKNAPKKPINKGVSGNNVKVIERVEAEVVAPSEDKEPVIDMNVPVEAPVMETQEVTIKDSPAVHEGNGTIVELNFKKKPKIKKKDTHTFYFSNEVYDKLKRKAEESGANVSELLEYILVQVLK